MRNPAREIDVLIPVYNAPELVRACIDSLYAHAEPWIHETLIEDDGSGDETARMLDELRHPRIRVHHAPRNRGFPTNVNEGMGRASTPFVLVLNSDTEAHADFIGPLVAALESEPSFAAVSPAGNTFRRYDLSRYRQRAGCAVSHSLWAFACLIRREVFVDVGGFDPDFGSGYFEDLDLSRRLTPQGWLFGVCPEATIDHVGHASFGANVGPLLEENAVTYHGRYPEARRNVVMVTAERDPDALSSDLVDAMEEVLANGGRIHWVCPKGPIRLPSLQVGEPSVNVIGAALRILRARRKAYRSYTDLWMTREAPLSALAVMRPLAKALGMRLRRFTG